MAPAFVVETVAELALSMRTPLHLPPVNVAPPESSIRFVGAFVVAVSVSPAVNVPPHTLPTKEAVLWESLTDMAPMMVVPTVKGRAQSILSGVPLAACSRRSSIGDSASSGTHGTVLGCWEVRKKRDKRHSRRMPQLGKVIGIKLKR